MLELEERKKADPMRYGEGTPHKEKPKRLID